FGWILAIPVALVILVLIIGKILDLRTLRNAKARLNSGSEEGVQENAPAVDTIPKPSYKAYGFEKGVRGAAQYKFTAVVERLRRGEKLQDIMAEYFGSYRNWRKTVMRMKDEFDPTIEDLWLFFLLQEGSIYFQSDTPSFFNYLFDKALQMRNNRVGKFVRGESVRWYDILALTLSTLKGIGPGGKYSQLVPYQHLFSIDDLEEMFRTKDFIDYYAGMTEQQRSDEYGKLTADIRAEVVALKSKIDELNIIYGDTDKPRVKEALLKTAEYKDYVAFMQGEWNKEKPLFFKTYPDLVGGWNGVLGWLHIIRNNYKPLAAAIQVTLVAAGIILLRNGILLTVNPLIIGLVAILGIVLIWFLVPQGLNLIINRIPKRYGRTTRPDEGYSPASVSRGRKAFRVVFWVVAAGLKIVWNAVLFHYILIATGELAGVVAFGGGILGVGVGWLLMVGMWIPFALFFFLDIFAIFYLQEAITGYIYGKWLGLGVIKEGKILGFIPIQKKRDFLEKIIEDKFISKGRSFSDEERRAALADIINLILEALYNEDMITKAEWDANKWVNNVAPQDFFSLKNKKMRKRISVFLNSLLMDSLRKRPFWEKIRTLTSLVPVGPGETLIYSYAVAPGMSAEDQANTLDTRLTTGITNLTHLITRYPDEWLNFIARMGEGPNPIASPNEIARMKGLKLGDVLGKVNPDLEWEIRLWASYRFQPFARTLNGLMHYPQVLRLFARMDHPDWSEDKINEEVNRKYQLLWAHQGYGDYVTKSDPKAEETRLLAEYYYKKHRFLIDFASLQKREDGFWYNVFARYDPKTGKIKDKYTIKLTKDFPIVSEGKPGNQTHSRRFARGEIIMTMDINQDFYIEQALKIPAALTYFDENAVAIVGYPEDIFTDTYNDIGAFHALADRSFNSLVQRTLTLLGARFHYGHPDFWRASYVDSFGGVSRSYPVNEDIFGGYEMTLKGKKILYVECLEAGKARDGAWGTTFGMFLKFGMGATQQFYSRYVYYLYTSKNFGFFEGITHFFGGIGYYFRKPWVILGNFAYIIFLLVVGVSGFSAFPLEILFALGGVFVLSQAITWTGFFQYILENPGFKGIFKFIKLWFKMSPFFMAHVFTYAAGVNRAVKGIATYMATGRGFMAEHTKLSDILKSYGKTHVVLGFAGIILSLVGMLIWNNPTLVLSLPFIIMMLSAWLIPFTTNRSMPFSWKNPGPYFKQIVADYKDGRDLTIEAAVNKIKSVKSDLVWHYLGLVGWVVYLTLPLLLPVAVLYATATLLFGMGILGIVLFGAIAVAFILNLLFPFNRKIVLPLAVLAAVIFASGPFSTVLLIAVGVVAILVFVDLFISKARMEAALTKMLQDSIAKSQAPPGSNVKFVPKKGTLEIVLEGRLPKIIKDTPGATARVIKNLIKTGKFDISIRDERGESVNIATILSENIKISFKSIHFEIDLKQSKLSFTIPDDAQLTLNVSSGEKGYVITVVVEGKKAPEHLESALQKEDTKENTPEEKPLDS
ncbi:MAG: hypothetical protein WCL25_03945, partial [bacterium]